MGRRKEKGGRIPGKKGQISHAGPTQLSWKWAGVASAGALLAALMLPWLARWRNHAPSNYLPTTVFEAGRFACQGITESMIAAREEVGAPTFTEPREPRFRSFLRLSDKAS